MSLPPNLDTYFTFTIGVGNFNIIDWDSILDQMFDYDEEEDESPNVAFENMGYESIIAVRNLGTTFFIYLLSVPIVLGTFLLLTIKIQGRL
jgi:hypothetical protein